MAIKKILNKIFKGKPSELESPDDVEKKDSGDKIAFDTTVPDVEESEVLGEIDILVNDEKINTFLITAPETKIGRDPSKADIIISELIVSKLHCSIFNKGESVLIKDCNSTNGVYISSERITERELDNRDVIFLGKKGTVKMIFRKREEE